MNRGSDPSNMWCYFTLAADTTTVHEHLFSLLVRTSGDYFREASAALASIHTPPPPPTRSCWCFGVPYRITSLKRTQLLLALCLLTRDKERCLLLQAMTDYEPSAASYERRPETERGILHLFLAKKHCCSAGLSPQPWQPRKLPSQPLYQPLCRWNTVIDSASLCSSYPWAIGLHFVCPRSQSAYG